MRGARSIPDRRFEAESGACLGSRSNGESPYVWFASLHSAFHSTPLRVVRGGASRW